MYMYIYIYVIDRGINKRPPTHVAPLLLNSLTVNPSPQQAVSLWTAPFSRAPRPSTRASSRARPCPYQSGRATESLRARPTRCRSQKNWLNRKRMHVFLSSLRVFPT